MLINMNRRRVNCFVAFWIWKATLLPSSPNQSSIVYNKYSYIGSRGPDTDKTITVLRYMCQAVSQLLGVSGACLKIKHA